MFKKKSSPSAVFCTQTRVLARTGASASWLVYQLQLVRSTVDVSPYRDKSATIAMSLAVHLILRSWSHASVFCGISNYTLAFSEVYGVKLIIEYWREMKISSPKKRKDLPLDASLLIFWSISWMKSGWRLHCERQGRILGRSRFSPSSHARECVGCHAKTICTAGNAFFWMQKV